MSRTMKLEAAQAFRVVTTRRGGDNIPVVYGPFATLGAAKGIATRECSADAWRGWPAIPYEIQRSKSEWETVASSANDERPTA